ncbi:transcription repressor OFP15-like [Bidens hawaiensis]|uniref:transcription repressor OFP15-like n=1 Tax=Bidens hawaiensis TaxID=980011 RepID=UPI00404B59F6
MGRKLQFLPTCGSPSRTLSFKAATASSTAISFEFDDMLTTGSMTSSVESAIRELSSDRFFFNPGHTKSILEEAKPNKKAKESVLPFKESVSMMEMQSTDPFVDFKKSMQEMVEADSGLKKWENLQKLLSLYLTVNDKVNHGYIIEAFVDLLFSDLGSPLSASSSCSSSASCSSSSSPSIQEKPLLMESGCNSKNKMVCSESTESALSFTSASSSETCLSSCSLEEDLEKDDDI